MLRLAKRRANGEGSIFKRPDRNLWCGEVTVRNDETGKLTKKRVYGKTQKIVRDKITKLKELQGTGVDLSKKPETMYEIIKSKIDYQLETNEITEGTFTRKIHSLKVLEKYDFVKSKTIDKVTDEDLSYLLKTITDYSESVISKVYGLVNMAFRLAIIKGYLYKNPLDNKERFKKPKSMKPIKKVSALTVSEQKKFIDVLFSNPKLLYKEQMLISLYTGLRMGEINALTVDDIDFEKNTIHICKTITRDKDYHTYVRNHPKTKNGIRVVNMNNALAQCIKEYINRVKPKDRLFLAKDGSLVSTSQVNSEFKRICEKHKINKGNDVNQHMLRHTFATRCIESGMPAKVLQKLLGHSDIKTTLDTYCDVFFEYEEKHLKESDEYLMQQGLSLPKNE